ncbi:Hsp70 family protein [Aspergillus vadensis CBS 113365]|uniref:Actin-like ATPase domain-containing protein n=1 Tax=Aspergillus vadensis (strain CBS 113365 / IMI 142717 / IBT 24658) TaxID=1448311 RepID=A0A319C4E3_ASPVC|nr:hypothetical protein BO88DRAFT_382362 [Aspergillus vadensis CBS 113365]PYH73153.1 hypothetical protein BO88DRAFT_382362 [Aspergillus vadensis CBS 113365]
MRARSVEWTPPGATSCIIPSVLAYPNGEDQQSTYGEEALHQSPRYAWTKMLVEGAPEVRVAGLDLNALFGGEEAFNYENRPATVRLISHFLSNIRDAFRNDPEILRELGTGNLPHIDWHFSLPACWGAEGLALMEAAINQAGFRQNEGRIYFATEGLAAAIAVANRLRNESLAQPGDRVLVCDLGGLTNDFTALDVVAVHPTEPHRLFFQRYDEDSKADCANPRIDQSLLSHLRRTLGLRLESGRVMHVGLKAAIATKHAFDGQSEVSVDLSFDSWYLPRHFRGQQRDAFDQQGGRFTFSQDALQQSMGPVVTQIQDRVAALIDNWNPSKIAIVGGLSRSGYLQGRLSTMLATRYPTIYQVPMDSFRGNDAITAVAHGLAIKGGTITHPMEYLGKHTYELVTPFVEELGTELAPHHGLHRRIAFTEVQARDGVPPRGEISTVYSIQQGEHVRDLEIRRYDSTGVSESLGFAALYFPPNTHAWTSADGTIKHYLLRAFWRLDAVVHAKLVWTFEVQDPQDQRVAEVGTITHVVRDLIPRWAS